MANVSKILTKPQFTVLSGLFQNLSASSFAIILISPGFGSIQNFKDFLWLLTTNLPPAILFLMIAMKLEGDSR